MYIIRSASLPGAPYVFRTGKIEMKKVFGILLAALLLAACGPGQDKKPVLEKERQTLETAKKIDATQQKEAEKQLQEADKQTQ